MLVYVDDILLAGSDTLACQEFKDYLNNCFRIKDLGSVKYLWSLRWLGDLRDYFLCLRKYTLEIVDECDLLGSKPIASPVEENHKFALADGALLDDAT